MSTSSEGSNKVSSTLSHQHPLTIAVEGNIGSGKSTFLSFCEHDIEVEACEPMDEPVNQWTNVNGVNLLGNYYRDPARWGMTFQMEVNLSMLKLYRASSSATIRLVERSLLSARNCFQKSMLTTGVLEPVMSSVLDKWYNSIDNIHTALPHAIVYLETSPSVAYHRVQIRGRPEEANVTLNYLQQLHQLHQEWIGHEQARNRSYESDMPIFIINADRTLGELHQDYQQCLSDLKVMSL